MTLQYKFFAISAKGSSQAEEELNKFLRSARVLNINREFTITGNSPMWCFAVEYLPGPSDRAGTDEKGSRRRVDYREVLAPEEFALFAKLREWRKEAAAKDAIPVYTIFTNEQLARIATNRITTKSGLLEIEGVGEAKINKYGDEVLGIVKNNNRAIEEKKQ